MEATLQPKMRFGNKPLCKTHGEMFGPIGVEESYVCEVPGCGVRWRAVTEYETFLRSGITVQLERKTLCPRPGHGHMFLAEVDRVRGVELWCCGVDGCAESVEKAKK